MILAGIALIYIIMFIQAFANLSGSVRIYQA